MSFYSPRFPYDFLYTLYTSYKSAISIKMQSYCRKVRRAPTPLTACLSQNGGHHSYGLNDEYLLQRCSSTCLKRQGGVWYSHLLTNNSRTTRPNPEPCTPTSTFCSLPLTLCEAPARKPADSLSRSPLRDSPQRPQRSGRPRSTRWPELIARSRRSREKEEVRKKKPNLIADIDF